MKRKTIIAFAIIASIVSVMLLTACGGASKLDAKKAQIMGKILSVNKVPYTAISSSGDKTEIIYESSAATNYDAQLVSDWAMIFATAANFNYTEITIVNTINGEPTARLTATSENVKILGNGWMNESEFWNSVEIKAVD